MVKAQNPELKKFIDRKVLITLTGNKKVTGTLRGYDPFINLVLEDTNYETNENEKKDVGNIVIRGSSVVMIDALEKT